MLPSFPKRFRRVENTILTKNADTKRKYSKFGTTESSSSESSSDSSVTEEESDLDFSKVNGEQGPSQSHPDVVPDDRGVLSSKGYTIGDEINSGTFATVRLAEYRNRNKVQKLAVKIIDKAKGSHQFVDKFLPRELLIWPGLHHCSIIKVHKIIAILSRVYVFMELAKKGSVIQYLQKNGAASEVLARRWFSSLARALKFCHKRGVAHRDVKCDNLLLDENLDLKLGDFGFTRVCTDGKTGRQKLSETYCGSAAYVAPEVIKGSPYDPLKADIWSSGVCLFVILNNTMPFDDTNIHKLHSDQIQGKWKFSAKVEKNLSDSSKKLVTRLLEPDTARRITLDQALQSSWMRR